MLTNTADFIVIDHVNHFTRSSLGLLLRSAGLQVREISDTLHRGAFVIIAENSGQDTDATVSDEDLQRLNEIAVFWKDAVNRLQEFENGLGAGSPIAIYGAGFYGKFIESCLKDPDRVACVLDQNPYLHGKKENGKPVLPPAQLPEEVETVLVGLNPAHARNIIADIPALASRRIEYFYL